MKIFKTALVLTLVGIACGLLIGLANQITAPIIADNKLKAELAAYEALFPEITGSEVKAFDGTLVYEVLVATKDDVVIGYLVKGKQSNAFGYIDMIVGFDVSGKVIGIEIIDFNQTPSYQAGIKERTDQFIGVALDNILAKGPQIDATAGGTSQGFNVVKAIMAEAVTAYKAVK